VGRRAADDFEVSYAKSVQWAVLIYVGKHIITAQEEKTAVNLKNETTSEVSCCHNDLKFL
jgi:hypothetical protein